jgi:guanosine-3',5'-bis(diphosphate) 3'-pyrophosphohydrolase
MQITRPNPFSKAWSLAAVYHQHQKYGDLGLPYLTHIGDVMLETICLLADHRDSDLAINCAILHDTIEDTHANYDLIDKLFGAPVADGVQALSKNPQLGSSWDKLTDSIDRILKQPPEIAIVKMADRIANLRQLPPRGWNEKKIDTYINQSIELHSRLNHVDLDAGLALAQAIVNYQQLCQTLI